MILVTMTIIWLVFFCCHDNSMVFSVFSTGNTNLFFILSCLAVLAVTFSFIGIIACRPRHPNLFQVRLQIRNVVHGFI